MTNQPNQTHQLYDLVLFDLDGTLVDSVPDLTTALGLMLDERELPTPTQQLVRRIIGEGQRSLVERAIVYAERQQRGHASSEASGHGDGSISSSVLDEAVLSFRRHYSANLCVKTQCYEGVVAVLQALSQHQTLAVATNKPGRWARALCDTLGLSPYLRWVLGEDDVGARKPDPKILDELCQRASVPTERALFVGDSRIDWQAAERAHMDFALCTYGYADEVTLHTATQRAANERLRTGSPQRPYICRSLVELLPIASQ
ncbi:MAG: HAD-IA family hydrolase [Myxococcales bacterium]|nr:HAD-IA family hydrolase [Myxococcales bacterium]